MLYVFVVQILAGVSVVIVLVFILTSLISSYCTGIVCDSYRWGVLQRVDFAGPTVHVSIAQRSNSTWHCIRMHAHVDLLWKD
jgi:hypothetical protein